MEKMSAAAITFAALAQVLYQASRGRVLEEDDLLDVSDLERETAAVAIRAALEAQWIDVDVETHKVPDATEREALAPEQRARSLTMGLMLAIHSVKTAVEPKGREERKRQLADHRDVILRVTDAVITAACEFLRCSEEETQRLRSAATSEGPVTIPIFVSVPPAEDLRTFVAWHDVLEHVLARLATMLDQTEIARAMQRIDPNDAGLKLIGIMALRSVAAARHDAPVRCTAARRDEPGHLLQVVEELREEARGHEIPADVSPQIVVYLGLTRQREVLRKYLTQQGAVMGLEAPEAAVFAACLEGATEALCLLRPSKDARGALKFLRRRVRRFNTTH